jgi:hypothetical protein
MSSGTSRRCLFPFSKGGRRCFRRHPQVAGRRFLFPVGGATRRELIVGWNFIEGEFALQAENDRNPAKISRIAQSGLCWRWVLLCLNSQPDMSYFARLQPG